MKRQISGIVDVWLIIMWESSVCSSDFAGSRRARMMVEATGKEGKHGAKMSMSGQKRSRASVWSKGEKRKEGWNIEITVESKSEESKELETNRGWAEGLIFPT